jgi:hypothetical protein
MNGRRGVWLNYREVDSIADLDAMLDRLPAGAIFRWEPGSPMNPGEKEMKENVRVLLSSHRMTLQN